MLCIRGTNVQWHVGEPIPEVDILRVVAVNADGDELQYIISRFPNLPYCNHRGLVQWFGDHAKFIVANL